jgi:hypothetical protein
VREVRRLGTGLRQAQERVERTSLGQGMLSALILIILITAVAWCVPDSALRRTVRSVVAPIAYATGLDQYWGVFSPDPPRRLEYVDVVVTLRDGRVVVWNIPHGDPVIGHYSTYHWHKLKENLVRAPSLQPGLARWVARSVAGPAGGATRVKIVLRTVSLPPPGSSVASVTGSKLLYDEKLSGT